MTMPADNVGASVGSI